MDSRRASVRVHLMLILTLIVFQAALAEEPTTSPATAMVGVDAFGPGFLPVMPWDPQHGWRLPPLDRANGLASIAECGFNMAGFVQSRDIAECERLGLKAIIAPPDGERPWAGPWRDLTDEQIESRVRQQIDTGGSSAAVVGYFIMDEPGTRDFPALAKAVAAVRKYAPGKLAYINLFPGYATIGAPDHSQLGAKSFTEYLERYVAEVKPQFISYDNYMVQYSNDLQAPAMAARYFNDLLEVRRVAMKHGLSFWNIVSSNQIRPVTTVPSPANLMLQGFTTLAAGGHGVTWFTYYATSGSSRGYAYAAVEYDDHRTDTWLFLQMVNRQIRAIGSITTGLTSTGVFASTPLPDVKNLPLLPGRVVERLEACASRRDTGAPIPPIMIGEFAGPDGNDHIMLVNLSLQYSAHIKPSFRAGFPIIERASTADGAFHALRDPDNLWLTPGQGCLLRLR